MMKTRFYCLALVFFLHIILCLDGVTPRHFSRYDAFYIDHKQGTVQNLQSLELNHTSNNEEIENIGSRPPSCEHKCYGCMPCEAIQVPTASSIVGVQYTNYEPEGWKCKCGPTFYSP